MKSIVHIFLVILCIQCNLVDIGQCSFDQDSFTSTENSLGKCLAKLSSLLNDRGNRLRSMVARAAKVWTIDGRATVKVPVFVSGSVVASNVNATRIVLVSTPRELLPSHDGPIIERLMDEKSVKIFDIERRISKDYVLKSNGNVAIRGTLTFTQPIQARKVTFDQLTIESYLNQVPVWYMKERVLRKSGRQVITGRWSFTRPVTIKSLNIKGTWNGVKTDDFLLPKSRSHQVVTGSLSFSRGQFRELAVERLNGVLVKDFVKRFSFEPQFISGQKHFKSVKTGRNLDLKGLINEKNLTEILTRAIPIDRVVTLNNDLEFSVPIKVDHLKAKRIGPNVDVDFILNEGIVQGGFNKIVGKKVFTSLKARNITVRGPLNKVSIPNDLVPLNEYVMVSSKVVFAAPVDIRSSLNVNYINNINPTRDVVLLTSSQPQVVGGEKRFMSDLSVTDSVDVQASGKLNGIDPLQLQRKIRQIDVQQKVSNYVFDGLSIMGNLVVNRINNVQISDLPSILWSRTRSQTIVKPVRFTRTLTADKFDVPIVNDLRIPHDLVLKNSKSPQFISGSKTFQNVQILNRFIVKSGSLNGHDVQTVKKELLTHDMGQKLPVLCRGNKRFLRLDVTGNVRAFSVNGLNISRDYMLVDRPQLVYGHKTFVGPVEVSDWVHAEDVIASNVNKNKVEEIFNDIVLNTASEIHLFNKRFSFLKANDVKAVGTLNGINLETFKKSVMTVNTPQNIWTPIIFHGKTAFDRPISVRSIDGRDVTACLGASDRKNQRSTQNTVEN